ncbi:uncharacterized protein FFB20_07961 [Fusarium fujikuroi]|nr:uncharacterized protein FFB20_07961 [Fusarium fujikuroi]SCN87847.1 uncharacterized protein FFC1_05296 [Fusarium fujikuroi]SCN92508.1 uncharacterized protein FFE2_07387 [Fusarium fujikuroi]SCO42509.1 uncharacterized protein FFNC_08558 [Fusarium fujikuroi]SCO42804.1 uncharacterized protein FFMR_06964 [Fusarium fujikuroi]
MSFVIFENGQNLSDRKFKDTEYGVFGIVGLYNVQRHHYSSSQPDVVCDSECNRNLYAPSEDVREMEIHIGLGNG